MYIAELLIHFWNNIWNIFFWIQPFATFIILPAYWIWFECYPFVFNFTFKSIISCQPLKFFKRLPFVTQIGPSSNLIECWNFKWTRTTNKNRGVSDSLFVGVPIHLWSGDIANLETRLSVFIYYYLNWTKLIIVGLNKLIM